MIVMDRAKLAQRHFEGHPTHSLCQAAQPAAKPSVSLHAHMVHG